MAYINQIYEWEGDDTQPYSSNYTWKSKEYLLPVKTIFSAGRVIATFDDREDYYDELAASAAATARNAARISGGILGSMLGSAAIGERMLNGDTLETVPTVGDFSGDYNCTLNVYVGGTLAFTKEIYSDRPFRIGAGRGRSWAVEITGNVIVKQIDMASSMKELKQLE
ncbi:hypothetical protein KKE60_04225 [Patescibacteria group bacterium]|nr:hypothetical protein [Patescibacteria group bacterium]